MGALAAGLFVFVGVHAAQWPKGLRAALIAKLGLGPWKLLYSLVSAVGIALIVWGYGEARPAAPVLYEPPVGLKHAALALVPLAFVLLVAAYLPTGAIKQAVKHPMLLAVKLWAAAHLLANGDLASVALFGGFLAYAVIDRISVARRERAGLAQPPRAGKLGWIGDLGAIVLGLALSAAMILWLHPLWFGVAVLPA